jgi:PAS domain S-box-containing protein
MSSADQLSELESLRLQVADLERILAERDRSAQAQYRHLEATIQNLREQSHLLCTIVEGTAAETGDAYITSLVTLLTSTLHVQYAVIGEVSEGQPPKIRTLAVSAGGTLVDNFDYELADTPCADALTQTVACFDRDVQAAFPQFQRLADLGAESYCGVPLRAKSGTVMGLLAVMDTKPFQHGDFVQSLLGTLTPRVVVEFERRRVEQERAQALDNIQNIIETVPDILFTLDTQGNLVKWNRRLADVTGYSQEELLNKPALAFVPLEEQTRTAAAIQRAFTEGYAELDGQMFTKDFRTIPYQWTGALLKNAQGEPIGITGVGRDVSEKKQAEEELTQQRCHLVDAQALAHLGSWGWDIDTGVVQWSDELFRIFGHEPGSIHVTYDTFLAALLPDDHDRVLVAINAALAGKMSYDIEYRIVRPNSEVRSIHVRGDVYRDATGHPLSMAGTVLDITERKRIEDALRASEERLVLAVEGSTDILWDAHRLLGEPWYAPQTPIWWSPRVRELLGLEESEPFETLEQWVVRLHPDDKDHVFAQLAAHIEHRSPYDAEFRMRTNRGDYLWVRGRGQAMRDEQGEVRRMSGSCQDITARKLAEDAVREAELRYRTIFEQAGAGVARIESRTSRFVEVNRQYCEIVGLTEAEMLATTVGAITHPDDLERNLENGSRLLSGELPSFTMEKRYVRKDGSIVWVNMNVAPLWRPGETPVHHIAIVQDITEHKRAEEALRRSERQLRTVLDALPVGVWFTDQSGKPVLSNPAAKQIWSGIKQIKIETVANAAEWRETIGPSNELHRWALSHALTRGVPSPYETFDFECLDGTKKTVRNTTVPVHDEAGVVLGAIVLNEDITALRQTQETLRLTQFSVDHAVEGFFWISPDAKILHVNNAACQMLEYSQDELMAMTMSDIDPTLPPDVWPDHWRELKQKGSLTFELKHWSKTGRVLDTEVIFKYLQYEGKEYSCAIMRDIGERRRAEAALRASEERYRALYDETPTMYFTLATDGTVRAVNRFGAEQLGYQAEELIGHSVLRVFYEQDRETVAANLAECLAVPETTRHWEFRKLRKDGSMIWVQETARMAPSGTGETVVLVTCEDVTERKQAEQRLEFFRALLDHVDDSIEIIDPQGGRFLDGNAKAALNLGYTRDEFLALTVPDIDPVVTAPVFAGLMQGLRGASAPLVLDSIHRRKDGTTFPVEVSAQLIRLDKEYLVAIVRDITERKRVEEVLRQQERELRAAVEERERISQDLHDGILQSLFAMGLTLETTKSMMFPRNRQMLSPSIDQVIDQLNRVMHEIRNFIAGLGSDLLKGKDLPTALEHMLETLTQHHATRVHLALDERAVQALSAEQSLHLILVVQEAVSNCIRHGRAQEATVSLKMLKQSLRLSIRDNGGGFDTATVKGIGHGLNNMAARAQKVGGRFTVFSKINKGTRVVFDLPKEAASVRC